MPPKHQIDATVVVKEIERVEGNVKYIEQTVIPDIFKRLNTIEAKLAALLVLWSFNLILLGIATKQVFK